MNTQKAAGSDLSDIVLQEMEDDAEKSTMDLPSAHQLNQVVFLKFNVGDSPLTGIVHGVHFYPGKVKYDIAIMLDGDQETRIYNVDSCFVNPA